MILLALLLQAASPALPPPLTATPSPEAVALGRRLADAGTLATLLPIVIENNLAELAAEPGNASPAQRAAIVATGRRMAAARREQLLDGTARAYARYLSIEDLRTLVAAADAPAARRKRAADLPVIVTALQAIQGVDLQADVAAAVCAERKLLCDR